MKGKNFIIVASIIALFSSIYLWNSRTNYDQYLLLSEREAPLGKDYFTIYKDSTFEYISRGLSEKQIYKGIAKIKKDSIHLNYTDSIPIVGERVLYSKKYVDFIDLKYCRLETSLNKLKE